MNYSSQIFSTIDTWQVVVNSQILVLSSLRYLIITYFTVILLSRAGCDKDSTGGKSVVGGSRFGVESSCYGISFA